jgi:hypothetical protein
VFRGLGAAAVAVDDVKQLDGRRGEDYDGLDGAGCSVLAFVTAARSALAVSVSAVRSTPSHITAATENYPSM